MARHRSVGIMIPRLGRIGYFRPYDGRDATSGFGEDVAILRGTGRRARRCSVSEEAPAMINGLHCVIYSRDVDADRAFFAKVMGWRSVDVGGGRLIFATPPGELNLHEAEQNGRHELYLVADDLQAEIARLKGQGISCAPVTDEGWGLLTAITLPGGGSLGLYQPRHARP